VRSGRKASLKLGIYWIGSAYEMDFVSTTLFIPPRTIYHYLNEYHKSGKTCNAAHGGGRAHYLTDEQENAVEEDLKNTV
jgi:transposase